MDSSKIISILIPIYNRLEITKEGLEFLYKSLEYYEKSEKNSLVFKIIVIDDGSTDGSSDWISNNYKDIHLLKGDGNLWWSGSINMGARYAIETFNSDYLFLLNDDAIIKEDYFVNLEFELISKGNCIIGSNIFDINTKKSWSSLMAFNRFTGVSRFISNEEKKPIKWVTGMGVLIPVQVINTIGYWDQKNFPQYFGDSDFGIRASKTGYKVICCENLVLYNKTEYSSYKGTDIRSFFKSLSYKNKGSRYNLLIRLKFYRKHCVTPLWILTFFAYNLKYMLKTFIFKNL